MSREKDIELLEEIVDRHGLAETVSILAEIADAKAERFREEDDDDLADEWDGMADALTDIDWEGE